MSVAAGSLTINAAFLQEIKEDNRELRQILQEAESLFSHAASAPSAEPNLPLKRASDLLSGLRDRLAIHFSLEESFGYFENAVEAAPRLSNQAVALKAEHEALFRKICDVVERAERLLYGEQVAAGATKLLHAWRSFSEDLKRHEERERELILEALDGDLGGGD